MIFTSQLHLSGMVCVCVCVHKHIRVIIPCPYGHDGVCHCLSHLGYTQNPSTGYACEVWQGPPENTQHEK